jgi:hypothetical protein
MTDADGRAATATGDDHGFHGLFSLGSNERLKEFGEGLSKV